MLLMSPGIKGGTATIIAAAARQFCERHKARPVDAPSKFGQKGLQFHMNTCTFHEADTLRERRHVCGVRANTRRGTKQSSVSEFLDNDKEKPVLTSVTMIPVI